MSQLACSRAMPKRLEHLLVELEALGSVTIGQKSKTAATLVDLGFAVETERRKRKITIAPTPRGKNALERQRRGVDPYLVMTAG